MSQNYLQNKKDGESSKLVRSFIPSWQIEFPEIVLVVDTDTGMLCRVCIGPNI